MKKPKILLADDDLTLVTLLQEQIECVGTCTVVTTLRELLHEIYNKYDICILDLVYKGEGALDIYNITKNLTSSSLIIISAYARFLDTRNLRPDVVILPKPFKISELLGSIQELLEEQKIRQSVN